MRALDPDRLSVVFGWHSGTTPLSARDLASLPPLLIANQSLHSFAMTETALPLLAALHPDLVRHRDDSAWVERNLPEILGFLSRVAGLTRGKLDAYMAQMEQCGVAVVEDMALTGEAAFQVIRDSPWAGRIPCWATLPIFLALSPASKAAVHGLKFFADGAQGSRTAAISDPYLDGRRGVLLHSLDEMVRTLGEGQKVGKPAAIHAIGDLAIEQVLGALEQLDRGGLRFPAVRMEHVQFITEAQARRARDLGVVLSMQPNFNSESRDYADRLGPQWLERNNPFRMLIDRVGFKPGVDLILGSDGMPHGAEYALQWSLFPLYPGQRLTLEECVAGYRLDAPGGTSGVAIDRHARKVTVAGPGGLRRA